MIKNVMFIALLGFTCSLYSKSMYPYLKKSARLSWHLSQMIVGSSASLFSLFRLHYAYLVANYSSLDKTALSEGLALNVLGYTAIKAGYQGVKQELGSSED